MILYAAEFIFQLSLGLWAGKDNHIILRRNNNAKLKIVQNKKSLTCYIEQIIPPKAQTAVQNIQATGPFV